MSKGLDALNEMRRYGAVITENCEIIEKELTTLEEIRSSKFLVAIPRMSNKSNYIDELLLLQKVLKIIKEIAKSYDIEFCDNKQSISFKITLKNKFILETIIIKNKEEYDSLKEVLL